MAERFDSLRLYSPAKYDGLPGWGIPARSWTWPGKDEVADYFEAYAGRFSLPVRTGVTVDGLSRGGDGYVVTAGAQTFEATNVVVASGTWQTPVIPDLAEQLDPGSGNCTPATTATPPSCRTDPCWWSGAATPARTSRWRFLEHIGPRSAALSAARCRSTSRDAPRTSRSRSCGSWPITFSRNALRWDGRCDRTSGPGAAHSYGSSEPTLPMPG